MVRVENPVLAGFNPDPCLFRGRDAYYILVSTFEYLPGIRVYKSNDMVNWEYKTSILTDIDLSGNTRGCSIWAPYAVYSQGKYYVIYTDVKSTRVPYKDVDNYVIVADSIEGPWSKPYYINSYGFDPSIFVDGDKAYFLNEYWDYRLKTHNKSAGIMIQEINLQTMSLIGDPQIIFKGTEAQKTEAPEIYKHNGYYYLLTAEGGTDAGHMVTVCRSENVFGPYVVDPNNPMLTAKNNSELTLQCAGHASLVEGPAGDWFMAHLMTRPIEKKYPLLGRETSIQNVEWTDDNWLRLKRGGVEPSDYYDVEDEHITVENMNHSFHDGFTTGSLNFEQWNTLRKMPNESWLNFVEDGIEISGGQSMQSVFDQHLIGKRQIDFKFETTVDVTFNPTNYMQLAGMALYLDIDNYLFMAVSYDENVGKCITMLKAEAGEFSILSDPIPVTQKVIQMKIKVDGLYSDFCVNDGTKNIEVLNNVHLGFLSGGYTGNFVALDAVDMGRRNGSTARFQEFDYQPLA